MVEQSILTLCSLRSYWRVLNASSFFTQGSRKMLQKVNTAVLVTSPPKNTFSNILAFSIIKNKITINHNQSSSSIVGFFGIITSFFLDYSASFNSFAFLLQAALWLGQSPTWHSLEQYQTLLHLEHRLKACFWHLLHLKPYVSPSMSLLVQRSASFNICARQLSSIVCFSLSNCYWARIFQSLPLQIQVAMMGICCTTKGLVVRCVGTFIMESSQSERSIQDRLGI